MLQKVLMLLTSISIILGGILVYANTAYFPMSRGVELETKVTIQEVQLSNKLDKVITMLETK